MCSILCVMGVNADFKYKKGSDSVMVVKKEDYGSCNTKSPIRKMDDGVSTFTFDKSGPFFFISGNAKNCKEGQKLIVVVMAVRSNKPHPPSPAAAPAPSPASASPPAVLPTPGVSPQPSEGPSTPNNVSPAPAPSAPSGSTRIGGWVGFEVGVVLMLLGGFIGVV